MISPEFCVTQARYARWRNRQVVLAVADLEPGLRRRGQEAGAAALTGLCARQIRHDQLWLSRVDGAERPALDGAYLDDHIQDWGAWRRGRQSLDARLHDWTTRLTQPELEGELFWYSALDQRAVSRPMWICVSHLFTTQTEFRGRIEGQLVRMGAQLDGGELIGLPHDLDWM